MSTATEITVTRALQEDAARMDAITVQLGWALHRQLAQQLKEHGLTVAQFTALRALARAGAPCTMSALAEEAMQIPATMTGIVDRLQEQGLVQRQPNPEDRRSYRVALTPPGEAMLREIGRGKRQRLQGYLAALSGEERQFLLRSLENFLASLTEWP